MDAESIYYELADFCRKYGDIGLDADEALSVAAEKIEEFQSQGD